MLEDEAARGRGSRIVMRAGREATIYLLNKKRSEIQEVEDRYGVIHRGLAGRDVRGSADERGGHGAAAGIPADRGRPYLWSRKRTISTSK
jgi:hypothetical protein